MNGSGEGGQPILFLILRGKHSFLTFKNVLAVGFPCTQEAPSWAWGSGPRAVASGVLPRGLPAPFCDAGGPLVGGAWPWPSWLWAHPQGTTVSTWKVGSASQAVGCKAKEGIEVPGLLGAELGPQHQQTRGKMPKWCLPALMLPCRMSSPNAGHHRLLPQEESQAPPASPGGSPRSASVPEPASSPSTASASALRPGACEISCMSCKSGVCVPYNHLDLLNAFQNQVFWGLIFLCRTPRVGSPSWSLDPLLLREDLCNCDYPPFACCWPENMGSDFTTSLFLLPVSLWSPLCVFNCGKSSQLILRLFSYVTALPC